MVTPSSESESEGRRQYHNPPIAPLARRPPSEPRALNQASHPASHSLPSRQDVAQITSPSPIAIALHTFSTGASEQPKIRLPSRVTATTVAGGCQARCVCGQKRRQDACYKRCAMNYYHTLKMVRESPRKLCFFFFRSARSAYYEHLSKKALSTINNYWRTDSRIAMPYWASIYDVHQNVRIFYSLPLLPAKSIHCSSINQLNIVIMEGGPGQNSR